METQDTSELREILVIFHSNATTAEVDELEGRYPVIARMSPRIAVVADHGNAQEMRSFPEVESVLTGPADPVSNSLSESERLFVKAWQARQQSVGKRRRGEGLAWDAPGFLPPDPPRQD